MSEPSIDLLRVCDDFAFPFERSPHTSTLGIHHDGPQGNH